MIKFKEQDGELFRMLDEPVPLTPDAEMPCIIVPIQDDSPMGRYVKQCWGHDKLFMREYTICGINTDMAAKVGVAKDTPLSIHMFEIIGTFVKVGSDKWALYHAINGEIVTMDDCAIYKIQNGKLWECFPNDGDEWRVVADDGYGYWLEYIHDNTGWQIYTEPKPLLAEAKVGDLCKRRDGKYVQVDSYSNDRPCPVMCKSDIGGQDCFTLDGRNHNAVNNDKDIIFTEPLAPEGSKDWAWQMMLLGKIIIHSEYRHENATWKMNNGTARSCLAGMSACSKEQWVANAIGNGWQIYEKPNPEPQYKVGDCRIEFVKKELYNLLDKL